MSAKLEREAYIDLHREHLCVWLTANGIDPKDVPIYAWVRVQRNQIVCPVYQRNAEGKLFVDPENPDRTARTIITVPLVAEPDETVGRWLLWPWPSTERLGVGASGAANQASTERTTP